MDLSNKIGYKVKNIIGEIGTIVETNDTYVVIDFGTSKRKYDKSYFDNNKQIFEVYNENDPMNPYKGKNQHSNFFTDLKQKEDKRIYEIKAMIDDNNNVKNIRLKPIYTLDDILKYLSIEKKDFNKNTIITTNSITLISSFEINENKLVSKDYWNDEGDFILSKGNKNQDKIDERLWKIIKNNEQNLPIYLFVKIKDQYFFQGKYKLIKEILNDNHSNIVNQNQSFLRLKKIMDPQIIELFRKNK